MPEAMDNGPGDFTELASIILGTSGVESFLDDLVRKSVAYLAPVAVHSSVVLRRDGRLQTVASSHQRARVLDELQFRHHEGPCLDALRPDEQMSADDLASDARWASFRQAGVEAAISTPITAGTRPSGTLNVYSTGPHTFTTAERSALFRCADQVSGAVAVATRLAGEAELAPDLVASMAYRSLVDQAVGVIIGQQHCTSQEAFILLRQAGVQQNQGPGAVATRIILAVTADVPYLGTGPEFIWPAM